MMFHNSINSGVLILNIDDQVWQHLNLFQSATTTQLFLKKCYQEVGITEGEKRSYDNCYSFMYYLEQGELYYKQAYLAPLSIKPVLLFYGLVHLLKACVLQSIPHIQVQLQSLHTVYRQESERNKIISSIKMK